VESKSQPPRLFAPLRLGGITLPNRMVVAPMCQYSATDGRMGDWHLMHLGQFACSGAGLMMVEATGVTPEGRITPRCTGLYDDATEQAMARAIAVYRAITKHPLGIQLAHAGRKASTHPPFLGGKPLGPGEGAWQTVAPSPVPFGEGWPVPHELSVSELVQLKDSFVKATARAKRLGFDVVELHSSHGYLLHQFLSPLANQRKDAYGADRMKFPLEVAAAVREAWPRERCLGARISANDWVEGGLGPQDAVAYARELKRLGLDYVCVSSGAMVPHARIPVAPGYQVEFASQVKASVPIAVRAVGMIADPDQAEAIVASGKADLVAMARAFLDNPRWVWHAAERFGVRIDYPPQYARSRADVWPGARLARPEYDGAVRDGVKTT
jgi:2,4-dienoyl-CoA reductase-like NADH-dependent reductase (Old Yellow Enzyme family)